MIALAIDFLLFSDPCEKKATVIGIIGKTHGVRTPAKPASSDMRKKLNNLLPETTPLVCETSGPEDLTICPAGFSPMLISNSTSLGGEHVALLQAMKLTAPFTVKDDPRAWIF